MAQGHRKRSVTLLDDMLGAPWLLIFVVGVAVFIGLVWGLPNLAPDNIIVNSIAQGVVAVAWVVFGIFFLFCAAFYALAMSTRSRRPAATRGDADGGSSARRRAPEPAAAVPQVLEEEVVAAVTPAVEPGPAVVMVEPEAAPVIDDACSEPAAEIEAKPVAWSIDLIRAVEWKRFEDLCQKFYETSGIRSETTGLGPDGGMDILLYQDDSGKPTAIVQCAAGGDRLVGVRPVRELLGAMTHEKIGRAFFVTSGHFADAAKVVAGSNRITLINGDMFLIMVKRLPEAARKSLLEFATEGDYRTPTCPACGIKMKRLSGKAGGSDSWVCPNHPRCSAEMPGFVSDWRARDDSNVRPLPSEGSTLSN